MANPGLTPLVLGLIISLTILATTASHICSRTTTEETTEIHPCEEWLYLEMNGLVFAGFENGADSSNFDPNDDSTFQDKNCTFTRSFEKTDPECCPGWIGINCTEPHCSSPCENGGYCGQVSQKDSEPPACICKSPYSGSSCEENEEVLRNPSKKYCYLGNNCNNGLARQDAVSISDCCKEGFQGSWGSQNSTYRCSPCTRNSSPTVQPFTKSTCLSSGPSTYRTFDGVIVELNYTCAVPMVINSQFQIYAVTQCSLYNICSCGKTLFIFTTTATYIINGPDVTVLFGTEIKKINLKEYPGTTKLIADQMTGRNDPETDSSYYTHTISGLTIRADNSGSTLITADKTSPLVGNVAGVCGNFNLDAQDDTPLTTQKGIDSVLLRYKNNDIPCGVGLSVCESKNKALAEAACAPLAMVFDSYDSSVIGTNYTARCISVYCTVLQNATSQMAKQAMCNVFYQFQTNVKLATGQIPILRTEGLCEKKCYDGKVYTNYITTRCPLTCGSSLQAYANTGCNVEPYSGCWCPNGTAWSGTSCVEIHKCPCIGPDAKPYERGQKFTAKENCKLCTCDDMGVWKCNATSNSCTASCFVINNEIVQTFDSKNFGIVNPTGTIILLKSKNATVKAVIEAEKLNPDGSSSAALTIVVKSYDSESSIRVASFGASFNEGPGDAVTIRKVADEIYSVDLDGGSLRIFIAVGYIHIQIDLDKYGDQVEGLCGTPNGNQGDETKSLSTNAVQDIDTFVATNFDNPEARITEPQINYADKECDDILQITSSSTTGCNGDAFLKSCRVLQGSKEGVFLAISINCDVNITTFGHSLSRTGGIPTRRNVCLSSCNGYATKSCKPAHVWGSGCDEGKVYATDGTCVNSNDCGCRHPANKNIHVNNNASILYMDNKCTCKAYYFQCIPANEPVVCPSLHTSRRDLLAQQAPGEVITRKTCMKPPNDVIFVNKTVYLCYCDTPYKQTERGDCVEDCPCVENNTPYQHGEIVEAGCYQKQCDDGKFVEYPDLTNDCTGICEIYGGVVSLRRFDSSVVEKLHLRGMCEVVVLAYEGTIITITPLTCGSPDKACTFLVTIYTPQGETISYQYSETGGLVYNGNEIAGNLGPRFQLKRRTIHNDIIVGDNIIIYIYPTALVRIEVSGLLINSTSGACGYFSQMSTDDNQLSNGMQASSLSQVADSYIIHSETCAIFDVPQGDADTDLPDEIRRSWAIRQCNLLFELDVFKACREKLSIIQDYNDTCVNQVYHCEIGQDCDCVCDAIAVAAFACTDNGIDVGQYKHYRFCSPSCPSDGSQYTYSIVGCEKVCGQPANNNSLCSKAYTHDGCVCPEKYARKDNSPGAVCIPEEECPCYYKDSEIQSGQVVIIECQHCACTGGDLVCTGDKCQKECPPEQYRCNSGECIDKKLHCNGIVECEVGDDDEWGCEEKCNEFTCNSGQCVPKHTKCDSIYDCFDQSDELDCEHSCSPGEFYCNLEYNLQCIPSELKCDGSIDCQFAEDEMNCNVCPENYTHCNQTTCIDKAYWCDGADDCGDGSDEKDCTTPTTPPIKECELTLETITEEGPLIEVKNSEGTEGSIFTDGLRPPPGGKINTTFTVRSATIPTIVTVDLIVIGDVGTNLTVYYYTQSGVSAESFRLKYREVHYHSQFKGEAFSFRIVTNAVVKGLVVEICYEPAEFTTPPVTTPEECTENLENVTKDGPNVFVTYINSAGDIFSSEGVKPNRGQTAQVTLSLNSLKTPLLMSGNFNVFAGLPGRTVFISIETPNGNVTEEYKPTSPNSQYTIRYRGEFIVIRIQTPVTISGFQIEACYEKVPCKEGKCLDGCMEYYTDKCESPCPPSYCQTTPERTTSTLKPPTTPSPTEPPTTVTSATPCEYVTSTVETIAAEEPSNSNLRAGIVSLVSDTYIQDIHSDSDPVPQILIPLEISEQESIDDAEYLAAINIDYPGESSENTFRQDFDKLESVGVFVFNQIVPDTTLSVVVFKNKNISSLVERYSIFVVKPVTQTANLNFQGMRLILVFNGANVTATKCSGKQHGFTI